MAARKPWQPRVADKPYLFVSELNEMTGDLFSSLPVVGVDRIDFVRDLLISNYVVAQNGESNAPIDQQFKEVARVGPCQDDRPHDVMALHDFGKVQLSPWR